MTGEIVYYRNVFFDWDIMAKNVDVFLSDRVPKNSKTARGSTSDHRFQFMQLDFDHERQLDERSRRGEEEDGSLEKRTKKREKGDSDSVLPQSKRLD